MISPSPISSDSEPVPSIASFASLSAFFASSFASSSESAKAKFSDKTAEAATPVIKINIPKNNNDTLESLCATLLNIIMK